MLPTRRRRILLVEDNHPLREATQAILASLGHDVATAGDASEALDIWSSDRRFDLVFSDVVMPGHMNGVQLVQTMMAQAPGLKVLLTSGFADPANANDVIRNAQLPLIQKPYRKSALVAQLASLLTDA